MKIEELFRRLSYGELSNLSLADDGAGTIKDAARPRLVQYTNEALLRLHSRFILIENLLLLEQVGNITEYPLKSQYARSNTASTEPHKFIRDDIDHHFPQRPFQDDVIKILRVSDETGFVYPLNDEESDRSLFTPKPNVLQIPFPQSEQVVAVTYQARHPVLDTTLAGTDLTDQEFDVPFTLEGALQNYVAHLVYSHMNGQDNIVKAQEYLAKYEQVCAEIEKMDLTNQSISTTPVRFDLRGWV